VIDAFVKNIVSLFFDVEIEEKKENHRKFSAEIFISVGDVKFPNPQDLEGFLQKLDDNQFLMSFIIEGKTVLFSDKTKDLIDRIKDLRHGLAGLDKNIILKVKVEITKKINLNCIHIFDLDAFTVFLSELSLEKGVSFWSEFDLNSPLVVKCWHYIKNFNTGFIYFESKFPERTLLSPSYESYSINRVKLIENRDKSGHFVNAEKISFSPEDFLFLNDCDYSEIKSIFNGLHNFLLISFLSDFSSISNDELHYRVKGYKLLSGIVRFEDLKSSSLAELNEIYTWVYLDGNFTDKIGLARNVISIHLADESILSIEDGASDSVDSAYDLYLKENVKQYIEIKNKVNEFLQLQSDKSQELTKNVFLTIKTAILAFSTFFSSVFLLRVLSGKGINLEVSFDVLVVSFLLVTFFSIYFIVSIIEINMDKKRLAKRYFEVRDRYKDLLSESNLTKIIDAKKISEDEVKFIDKRRNIYIFAWVIICSVTLGTVYGLYKASNEVTTIEPEEIILNLDSAHINFRSDKDGSFLTPANR
jgi:hypothetical protein